MTNEALRPASDFTLLGTKNALYNQADITDLYAAKFDAPLPGAKVAIQAVAVSLRAPLLLTAVAQAPAANAQYLLKAA